MQSQITGTGYLSRFHPPGTVEVAGCNVVAWVIDHLVIRSVNPERAQLPITRTGYLSHFIQPGTVEAHGGDVVVQVTAWLDAEAGKPDWLAYVERGRQGELF